jgi:predicted PurR-regulated permease PerM
MQHVENKFFMLVVVLLLGGLLYLLDPILTPFFVGALLAYLTDPAVKKLARLGVPRLVSVVTVFFLLFAAIGLLILLFVPLVQRQIAALVLAIPNMVAWVQNTIVPWVTTHLGIDAELVNVDALKNMLVQNWSDASKVANWVIVEALHSGIRIAEWLMNLLLIPVVTFYLLCDWDLVIRGVRNLLPRQWEPVIVMLVTECDSVLSAFFRGQLLVMLALSIFYSVGLTLLGLQIGVIIGLIAGITGVVPYLGFILGMIVSSIAAVVQFSSITSVILVIAVFVLGHIIEHVYLTPKLVGNRIGLHPVAVIFAVLAGGKLFGFIGVLLALPVAAVIMVWVRYLYQQYRSSPLYQ